MTDRLAETAVGSRVAVIGAGIAGSACATGLADAGWSVTVFERSSHIGGRMATRRVAYCDRAGAEQVADFDHGAPYFAARGPRFKAVIAKAKADGGIAAWRQRVYAPFPSAGWRDRLVAVPSMPSFCERLLRGVPVRAGQAVQRLDRAADGWWLVLDGGGSAGPFDQVMIAMPPQQAAPLVAGHRDDWADLLATAKDEPRWTLLAISDEIDWLWGVSEMPPGGTIARIIRNDRKPGRPATAGTAQWVAHASTEWSAARLDAPPEEIVAEMKAALAVVWGAAAGKAANVTWQHAEVYRWRYAGVARWAPEGVTCWADATLGLGICGDAFGDGGVEAAWRSGDELADTVAARVDAPPRDPAVVDDVLVTQPGSLAQTVS